VDLYPRSTQNYAPGEQSSPPFRYLYAAEKPLEPPGPPSRYLPQAPPYNEPKFSQCFLSFTKSSSPPTRGRWPTRVLTWNTLTCWSDKVNLGFPSTGCFGANVRRFRHTHDSRPREECRQLSRTPTRLPNTLVSFSDSFLPTVVRLTFPL
jgi:hypothetical protein